MRPRLRRGVKREVAASSIIRDVLEAGRAEPLVAPLAPLGCRHQAGFALAADVFGLCSYGRHARHDRTFAGVIQRFE
jgi:hypothetical protein